MVCGMRVLREQSVCLLATFTNCVTCYQSILPKANGQVSSASAECVAGAIPCHESRIGWA